MTYPLWDDIGEIIGKRQLRVALDGRTCHDLLHLQIGYDDLQRARCLLLKDTLESGDVVVYTQAEVPAGGVPGYVQTFDYVFPEGCEDVVKTSQR